MTSHNPNTVQKTVLFLSQVLPWPPDAGPRMKTWNVIRYLSHKGYRVILISFVRREEEPFVHALQDICAEVISIPMKRSRLMDLVFFFRSFLNGKPFLVERDNLGEMQKAVTRVIKREKVDVIHADQISMVQFGVESFKDETSRPFLIFDAHNATWTLLDRMKKNAAWYLRPFITLEAAKMKNYEANLVRVSDRILAVSNPDREALLAALGDQNHGKNQENKVVTIPIAVDTEALQPGKSHKTGNKILTLGTLHYPPNADGIRWFARDVFPKIQQVMPDTILTIVGKNPPKDFYQLKDESGGCIKITGYVPDLDPYFDDAVVVVIPVRAGGGMRVRILEAFARGMPVVTTTVGLEGIHAQPGTDVMVEDTADGFAKAVVRLLENPDLRKKLGENSRFLAETQYDWQRVLTKLDDIYSG